MDSITVTFGGREVVLKKVGCSDGFYHCGRLIIEERKRFVALRWKAVLQLYGIDASVFATHGETAQAVVSSLESKLRDLVGAINQVLGE